MSVMSLLTIKIDDSDVEVIIQFAADFFMCNCRVSVGMSRANPQRIIYL